MGKGGESFHELLMHEVLKPLSLTYSFVSGALSLDPKTLKARNDAASQPHIEAVIAVLAKKDRFTPQMRELLLARCMPPSAERVTDAPPDAITPFIQHRLTHLTQLALAGDFDTPGSLLTSFVNLELQPQASTSQGARGQGADAPQPYAAVQALLAAHPLTPVWVLIGAPGGGKSTLLINLERERAQGCVEHAQSMAGAHSAKPELCFRVALADFTAAEQPDVEAWLQAELARQCKPVAGLGQPFTLIDLEQRFQLRYLFDGLNEIRAADGSLRTDVQERFMRWAAQRKAAGHPAPLFTVRRVDYQPLATGLDGDQPAREVDVLPWKPEQVRQYCDLRFPGQGNPVWALMEQHKEKAAVLGLMSNPFNLKLQCDLFAREGGALAPNRGALIGRIGLLQLAHALAQPAKGPGCPLALLTPADQRTVAKLAKVPGLALHNLELEGGLIQHLAALARWLHNRDGPVWSRFSLRDVDAGTARQALAMAQTLGMVVEDGTTLRFTHQLWQEYFAALSLAHAAPNEPWPETLRHEVQAIDTTAWELPSPKASDWDQCAQLATQIAAAPEPLLRHLFEVNLALAAKALHSRGEDAAVSDALRAAIKAALLARSVDATQPLPERIQAGLLLGHLGDTLRYTEAQRPGGSRCLLPKAVQPDGLPGWVPVPAGPAKIGEEKANVKVNIQAGLKLAFAPVTVAEFACFVQAGGYGKLAGEPPPWWQGAAAQKWWREGLPNVGLRLFWERQRKLWLADGGRAQEAETAAWLDSISEEDFTGVRRQWLDSDDDAFKAALDDACKAEPKRLPDFWHNPRFNNPLQPVVGVSVFEAEAYCRWLSQQAAGEQAFRLPTEAEWQVASGCTDTSAWPWPGAQVGEPDPYQHLNHFATKARQTTPVAVFPAGRSAAGLHDMAGQVWEWMANEWNGTASAKHMQALADMRDESTTRAVRGGSWLNHARHCRPALGNGLHPDVRNSGLGFRLLSCPIHGS